MKKEISRKNAALDFMNALKERRVNFNELKKELGTVCSAKFGRSWEEFEKFLKENSSNFNVVDKMNMIFMQNILAGKKRIWIYSLNEKTIDEICRASNLLVAEKSIFTDSYPLPILHNKHETVKPVLVDVIKEGKDFSLVFCSIRSYKDSVEYEYGELDNEVRMKFGDFDTLKTYKKVYFQAYDIVNIRRSRNRIELLQDYPERSHGDDNDEFPVKIWNSLSFHSKEIANIGKTEPENVFGAINEIYMNKKFGKILELKFRTLDGSIKHERMTKHKEDLREEKFHEGGAQAVDNKIMPYEISVVFEEGMQFNRKVDLSLTSSIKNLSGRRELYCFEITSISQLGQFEIINALEGIL
ncbi:hypothetical protein V8J88_11690 [Massilia sp. W12]|uniref:hypothetical protein n=1 Tax=Massilia sp. W12 TaxID=3126507 RepID=UPI0030CBBD21